MGVFASKLMILGRSINVHRGEIEEDMVKVLELTSWHYKDGALLLRFRALARCRTQNPADRNQFKSKCHPVLIAHTSASLWPRLSSSPKKRVLPALEDTGDGTVSGHI